MIISAALECLNQQVKQYRSGVFMQAKRGIWLAHPRAYKLVRACIISTSIAPHSTFPDSSTGTSWGGVVTSPRHQDCAGGGSPRR